MKVILGLFLAFLIIEVVMLPFPWTVASFRTENPKLTAFMKERISQAAAKHVPYKVRQAYVPLSGISNAMVHAVVVGEDGTFYEHDGVDWYEVKQSLQENWKEKNCQGFKHDHDAAREKSLVLDEPRPVDKVG